MKKSELKKIIKEEISKVLSEENGEIDIISKIEEKLLKHQNHSKEAHRAGYETKVYGYTGGEHDAIHETLVWVLNLLR